MESNRLIQSNPGYIPVALRTPLPLLWIFDYTQDNMCIICFDVGVDATFTLATPAAVIELAVEPVPVGSLQLNNHAQFVGSASIDLRSRGLKRRLSTPTIFEIYLQFMWMLRGCQCTVACMGLRSVCQSIIHACMQCI